jgi:hypothetical protein
MQENNTNEAPQMMDGVEENPDSENIDEDADGLQWLIKLAIGGFIGLCFVGLVLALIPVEKRMGHPARTPSQNKLRQISLAMMNYCSAKMRLPNAYTANEAGKPIHSWRVSLLPYIDQSNLYQRYSFDEPWDGPNNSKLHDIIVPAYCCPETITAEAEVFRTNYVLVTGAGTAFDGAKKVSAADIGDGMSNTLAIVEVKSSNTHWMEPLDITIDEMIARFSDEKLAKEYCVHPGEINIALLDGSTHTLRVPIDADKLRNLIEIADGNVVDIADF